MKKNILLALIIILFSSCHELESGIVIDKYFTPEHSLSYFTFVSTGKTSIPVYRTKTIPDRWYVTVEGIVKEKTKTETISVSKEKYESLNIGSFIRIKQ